MGMLAARSMAIVSAGHVEINGLAAAGLSHALPANHDAPPGAASPWPQALVFLFITLVLTWLAAASHWQADGGDAVPGSRNLARGTPAGSLCLGVGGGRSAVDSVISP